MSILLIGGTQVIRENVLSLHCGKVATTEELLLATDKRKASSSHTAPADTEMQKENNKTNPKIQRSQSYFLND